MRPFWDEDIPKENRLKKATPFVVSLTLHAVAIILISLNISHNGDSSNGEEKGGGPVEVELVSEEKGTQPQGSNEEIVPKQVEVEEKLAEVPPPPEPEDITIPEPEKPKPVEGLTECENDMWFGGIGIQQDWRTGEVEVVYPGYPAEQAGLQKGDVINFVDGTKQDRIRGEPGTIVRLDVFRPRTNEYLTFTIQRGKICIGKRL